VCTLLLAARRVYFWAMCFTHGCWTSTFLQVLEKVFARPPKQLRVIRMFWSPENHAHPRPDSAKFLMDSYLALTVDQIPRLTELCINDNDGRVIRLSAGAQELITVHSYRPAAAAGGAIARAFSQFATVNRFDQLAFTSALDPKDIVTIIRIVRPRIVAGAVFHWDTSAGACFAELAHGGPLDSVHQLTAKHAPYVYRPQRFLNDDDCQQLANAFPNLARMVWQLEQAPCEYTDR